MPEKIDLSAVFGLPPAEAIAFFENKGYQITWNWHESWKEANDKAFTVAKVARADLLQDIYGGVQGALNRGETERWFADRLTPLLQEKGWWGKKIVVGNDGLAEGVQEGSPRRLQTIFRTNLQTAYAAGRWQRFSDNAADRPYLQYVAVLDGRTRPGHARLNGKVFPIDSPVWKVIAPPNGFNCRCAVRALSKQDLEARGLKVETDARIEEREVAAGPLTHQRTGEVDPAKLIQRGVSVPDPAYPGKRMTLWTDSGWDYNPGASVQEDIRRLVEAKAARLQDDLATAMVREMVSGKPFVSWFEKPTGSFPVAVVAREDAALIGAKGQVAVFSAETHAKQATSHPDLQASDYARVQDVIEQGVAYQDSAVSLVYVLDTPDGMTSVVKATKSGDGLFLTSLRHLPTDAKERAAEIRRIERKAAEYAKK